MTDEIANVLLEALRNVRASQDRMEHHIHDLKVRMTSVEATLSQHQILLAQMSERLDHHAMRLARIERRLVVPI